MKKILLPALMMLPILGFANNNLPEIDVNCETLDVSIDTSDNSGFSVVPYWKNEAKFPDPPTSGSVGKYGEIYQIKCPNLFISDDSNVVEIKAGNYDNLKTIIPSYSEQFYLTYQNGYIYPSIREGFWYEGFALNIKDLVLQASVYDLTDGMDLSKNLTTLSHVPADIVVGYKVDGGELRPLIYDRKVSKYQKEFKNAQLIDIFVKYDKPVVMERLTLDKTNGSIRMYRNHDFPNE